MDSYSVPVPPEDIAGYSESFLMDVNSDPQKVTDLLSSLAVRLEQITGQASQYKQYQRDLQVPNFREENAHNYSKNGSNENVAL
ncbi:uncharacterized protein LOC143242998 isoform X1 [Tachypleus tridentatus]|uniref:uncharacterized protein LOC143242667 isoform X2 n=1 Tax=Tachypleus tridentatus TaxID=6853 RepID=UPI003FCF3447